MSVHEHRAADDHRAIQKTSITKSYEPWCVCPVPQQYRRKQTTCSAEEKWFYSTGKSLSRAYRSVISDPAKWISSIVVRELIEFKHALQPVHCVALPSLSPALLSLSQIAIQVFRNLHLINSKWMVRVRKVAFNGGCSAGMPICCLYF